MSAHDFADHHVLIEIGPIQLSEDDHAYVVGAYAERRRQAEASGTTYHLTDFVHDALIEASHR